MAFTLPRAIPRVYSYIPQELRPRIRTGLAFPSAQQWDNPAELLNAALRRSRELHIE
jgi:hypothetical protein